MPHPSDNNDEDVEIVPLELPLDRATIAWLGRMSANDRDAAKKVAHMLRLIREDDEIADRVLH